MKKPKTRKNKKSVSKKSVKNDQIVNDMVMKRRLWSTIKIISIIETDLEKEKNVLESHTQKILDLLKEDVQIRHQINDSIKMLERAREQINDVYMSEANLSEKPEIEKIFQIELPHIAADYVTEAETAASKGDTSFAIFNFQDAISILERLLSITVTDKKRALYDVKISRYKERINELRKN